MIGILTVIQRDYNNGMIRKLSFSLCLNDDYEGGNLVFVHFGAKTKIETFDKIIKYYYDCFSKLYMA